MMVPTATETYLREDVSFPEEAEGEDLAMTAANWCLWVMENIGQPLSVPFDADLHAEDPTTTAIQDQFADCFASASTLRTAVTGHWLDTPCFFKSGENIWSQMREANSLLGSCFLRLCLLPDVRRRLQLEQELVAKYSQFEQVEKIHLLDSSEGMKVFIWLDQVKYNDELMDRLLDQEWSLLHQFPENVFEVFYFPLPEDGAQLPIPDSARLVFG
jgi:hypothetical protein